MTELPAQMQRMLGHGDTNQDGVLDQSELQALAAQFGSGAAQGGGRGGAGRGGAGGGRGGRP